MNKTTFKPILVKDELHFKIMKRKAETRKRSAGAVIQELIDKEADEHGKTDGGIV